MVSSFFKEAWQKEKKERNIIGYKNKRKSIGVSDHQTGRTNKARDIVRKALANGKRISKNGKIYYENRRNRSDSPGSMI